MRGIHHLNTLRPARIHDLPLRRLLLGSSWEQDAALGGLLGLHHLNKHPVTNWRNGLHLQFQAEEA